MIADSLVDVWLDETSGDLRAATRHRRRPRTLDGWTFIRGEMQVGRWKLTPVASPDDPRWQGRAIWSEVIVEAPSAAFARHFAAEWELPNRRRRVGNESPSPKSGFEDEKLYWVRRLPEDEARHLSLMADGVTSVLRAVKMADRADEVPTPGRPLHL